MLIIVRTILIQLALGFRSRVTLQAENAVLHHQVEILRRRAPRRVHVTRTDRLFFKLILRLWPKAAGLIRIVHPKTLVRWHREGFRLYWRWRSRKRGGRPKIPKEIRVLVRQMSTENPLWGAPRIHGELLKLGFDISQATVSRHMCQWRSKKGPPRRCKKGPLGGCGLVPVVHGRAPRATRRALNRLTRRRAREGPVGPRGQAWAGWSVQLAVGV